MCNLYSNGARDDLARLCFGIVSHFGIPTLRWFGPGDVSMPAIRIEAPEDAFLDQLAPAGPVAAGQQIATFRSPVLNV